MTGDKREQKPCQCPYCNGPTVESLPFCQLCGAAIVRCPGCGRVLEQEANRCPTCGAEVERTARR